MPHSSASLPPYSSLSPSLSIHRVATKGAVLPAEILCHSWPGWSWGKSVWRLSCAAVPPNPHISRNGVKRALYNCLFLCSEKKQKTLYSVYFTSFTIGKFRNHLMGTANRTEYRITENLTRKISQ